MVGPTEGGFRTYLVERDGIDGHIDDAYRGAASDGEPVVQVSFDATGAAAFAALTGRMRGHRIAIVLDDVVTSAPVVIEPITGGRAQITLGGGGAWPAREHEADELAAVLRAGALPARLTPASENVVSATTPATTVLTYVAVGLALLALVSLVALVRWRLGGLAVGAVPLAAVGPAIFLLGALRGTLTLAWLLGAWTGIFAGMLGACAVLERSRRGAASPWPAAIVFVGLAGFVRIVGLVASFLVHGPAHGLVTGVSAGLLPATIVAVLAATALSARAAKRV